MPAKKKVGRPKKIDPPADVPVKGKTGPAPKLSPSQVIEAQRMMLEGKGLRETARHFKVGHSSLLRAGVTENVEMIKSLARELHTLDQKVKSLPLPLQISARSLAEELNAISTHLAGAAKYGAISAHRMNMLANEHLELLNPHAGTPEERSANNANINTVGILTEAANKSAHIGLNLLSANKKMIEEAASTREVTPGEIPNDPQAAAHAYKRIMSGKK